MIFATLSATEYYLRLTADLYPDIVGKMESYYRGNGSDE